MLLTLLKKIYRNKYIYILFHIKSILFYRLFMLFPLKNKIVISNYYGKGYGDNCKYIAEELKKDIPIVWLVNNTSEEVPMYIKKIKYNSLRSLYELATAKFWIDNCRKEFYITKRKRQIYIQTWHGCPPLKKIEKDVEKNLSKNYVRNAKSDSKKIDYLISNSLYMNKIYRQAFWYEKEILLSGCPRNDIFFKKNNNIIEKIRTKYKLNKETIILYAPTFRNDYSLKHYNIDFEKLKIKLEKIMKTKIIFMIRLHPNIIRKKMPNNLLKKFIIDVTDYENGQELLIASDILITDYSSIMFDFTLLKKPCFLYVPDIQEYKKDRNFYFEIEELPFLIAKTTEELINSFNKFDLKIYINKLEKFHKKIGCFEDGKASKRVAQIIKKEIKNK